MFNIKLSDKYAVIQEGTSEGTQIKYMKGGYWYKLDRNGNEGLCEYLASKLLTFSDLDKNEYIKYEQGTINGKKGCRSKNYLNKDEEFITFYRLYYNEFGKNLAEVLAHMNSAKERIEYTCAFVKEATGLDIRSYLSKVITLDRIILNEDRHVNNLAIIYCDDEFRTAPIFDNGHSLLTANSSVNWHFDMAENVKRTIAKPFSGSFDAMYDCLGEGFKLDKAALDWLHSEEQSRERDVLIYQLERLI